MPADDPQEWFQLTDAEGRPCGRATRRECHSDPTRIHVVVNVWVFDACGRVLLQRRAATKDTWPGCWDTSVGGHLRPDEDPRAAAQREMAEELGVAAGELRARGGFLRRQPQESEYAHLFTTVHSGPFQPDPAEIQEIRFWTAGEIEARRAEPACFTPAFLATWDRWRQHL
jgi:isopentenyl-diphosphate delta-isomerase type 1